jgi:hypothetical protein
MGIGTSLFLIAAGAILAFAVEAEAEGFDLNAIGVILMVVGGLGLVLSLIFWESWGGFHRRREVYTDADRPVTRVVEREY